MTCSASVARGCRGPAPEVRHGRSRRAGGPSPRGVRDCRCHDAPDRADLPTEGARHPYFSSAPDLNNRGGVDFTDAAFLALPPGKQLAEVIRRGVRTNGHQIRWCTTCGEGQGIVACPRCGGAGEVPTRPGGAGRPFFVGSARCKACGGPGLAACPECAAEEAPLRRPDATGRAWARAPAPGTRRHPYFRDDGWCWEGLPPRDPLPLAPGKREGSLQVVGWEPEDGIPEQWPEPVPGARRPRDYRAGDARDLRIRGIEDLARAGGEWERGRRLWEQASRWGEPARRRGEG